MSCGRGCGPLRRSFRVLDSHAECDYRNYMTTHVVKIGNSQGVRLPKRLLSLYGLSVRDGLEVVQTREGILLKPTTGLDSKLGWHDAYRDMAAEAAEQEEWSDWDTVAADGLHD
jgi:antitoxin component of MazEF toxin-antitoxin module